MAAIPRTLRLLAFAGAVGACLIGFAREAVLGEGSPGPVAKGPAPDFTLTQTSTRDTLTLSAFSEQPVLLFFYDGGDITSWQAIPYVNEWHRRYAGDGLKVIGVHSPRHEPLRLAYNALEVTSLTRMTYPVGLDLDRSVYTTYGLGSLPAYFVLRPGLEIVGAYSAPKPYAQVETAIQSLLAELKPGIINPFLVRPKRPTDDPAKTILAATPRVECGYLSGVIADCDSSRYDKPVRYSDSRAREKGKIYLDGYWTVGPISIAHEGKYASSDDHLRIIYSGKDVWLLPAFNYNSPQRVYVKQDRTYLDRSVWGNAIIGDEAGKPYILMRYSLPVHVVSNKTFSAHELELIPAEGDVAFYYLFFQDGVAE
jgi:peroxiredoxin